MAIEHVERQRGGVLDRCFVQVLANAHGHLTSDEMDQLIVAAGGTPVDEAAISGMYYAANLIVVFDKTDTSKESLFQNGVYDGRHISAMSTEELFHKLLPESTIVAPTEATIPPMPPANTKKTRRTSSAASSSPFIGNPIRRNHLGPEKATTSPAMPPANTKETHRKSSAASSSSSGRRPKTVLKTSMNNMPTVEEDGRNSGKKDGFTFWEDFEEFFSHFGSEKDTSLPMPPTNTKETQRKSSSAKETSSSSSGRRPKTVSKTSMNNMPTVDEEEDARKSEKKDCFNFVPTRFLGEEDFLKEVDSTELDKSPTRTISNRFIADPEREKLGQGGKLKVFKSSEAHGIVVVKYFVEGKLMFHAQVPSDPTTQIFGNAGEQNVFGWDAFNHAHSSGGTAIEGAGGKNIGARRYFFWCNSHAQLSIVLHHMFDQNDALVKKFFDKNVQYPFGGFYNVFATVPGHKIVRDEDDMEIECMHIGVSVPEMKAEFRMDPFEVSCVVVPESWRH